MTVGPDGRREYWDRVAAVRSERTFEDFKVARQDRGHVETDLEGSHRRLLFKPPGRQSADPGLFRTGDRLGGDPESVGGARLDLAKDKGPAAPDDQVQLAVPAPPVAGHHLITIGLVPGRGNVFASGAQLAAIRELDWDR
jgi:hypothetical protein